ncbi:unnamed protein product [Rhizophagus irregularis]|nr:unnamed protein product [Rhizophagus irregularis]
MCDITDLFTLWGVNILREYREYGFSRKQLDSLHESEEVADYWEEPPGIDYIHVLIILETPKSLDDYFENMARLCGRDYIYTYILNIN